MLCIDIGMYTYSYMASAIATLHHTMCWLTICALVVCTRALPDGVALGGAGSTSRLVQDTASSQLGLHSTIVIVLALASGVGNPKYLAYCHYSQCSLISRHTQVNDCVHCLSNCRPALYIFLLLLYLGLDLALGSVGGDHEGMAEGQGAHT